MVGAAAMALSSVSVIGNALRLSRVKASFVIGSSCRSAMRAEKAGLRARPV